MGTNDATVNLMKTDHYKVMVLLECTHSVMHTVEAVLDTGAGPNFVRESLCRRTGVNTRPMHLTFLPSGTPTIADLKSAESSGCTLTSAAISSTLVS